MTDNPLPVLETADTADSPVFETFLEAYQRAFILPDEMEDRDGFAQCLALNHGAAHDELTRRYGPFRELCVTARDADGAPVGGANFIALAHPARAAITANLNYVFVDGAARGKGWFRPLIASLRALIGGLFPGCGAVPGEVGTGFPSGTATKQGSRVLIFIEQNDPLLLTPEAYERDSGFSGLDQFDRLRIWDSQGAKVLDFPYVQPPLSAQQKADERLIYSVLGADGPALDACLLEAHLRGFFGISVLKGADPDAVPAAAGQLALLKRLCGAGESIALLDPGPALAKLTRAGAAALVREQNGPLRAWLKRQASML